MGRGLRHNSLAPGRWQLSEPTPATLPADCKCALARHPSPVRSAPVCLSCLGSRS